MSFGTNTTRLLVVQREADGSFRQVEHGAIGTRLGQGLRDGGSLEETAMRRSLDAAQELVERAAPHAPLFFAIATSAVRRAGNAAAFSEQVEALVGAPLRILSGEEEAAASFRGALAGVPLDGRRQAVLDIGGGSTECACGSDGRLERSVSFELGTVRLSEMFPRLDGSAPGPPARAAADAARRFVRPVLASLESFRPVTELRSVAGTPLTLGAIAFGSGGDLVSGLQLGELEIDTLLARLLELDLQERKALPGMIPQRADVLAAGAVILSEALRALDRPVTRLEVNDLLLGFLMDIAKVIPVG